MHHLYLSPRQEKLAYEIADSINDLKALRMHRRWVSTFPEHVLRQIQREVLSVPDAEIKTSRGRYFTSRVKDYELNPWD